MKYYLIVIDGFGIGADSVSEQYGDKDSNTALHLCQACDCSKWTFLSKLGLGNCCDILGYKLPGVNAITEPMASYGVLEKKAVGKDTQTGHWELAGMKVQGELRLFPPEFPSFPLELIKELETMTGRVVLGNKAASGTEIIQELGSTQILTEGIICYTSADSVMQIAAHQDVISLEELYKICLIARKICDKYQVGRVIARPFVGNSQDGYFRTKYRHDYSIKLPSPTLMETILQPMGIKVTGVGKIEDIFNGQGIDKSYPEKGNESCFNKLFSLASDEHITKQNEFIFTNLVDTDMLYGHRRDVSGYYEEMCRISNNLEHLYELINEGDFINIVSDHGCDPSFKGTDHTREYVPMLVCQKNGKLNGRCLGLIHGFEAAILNAIDVYKRI